MNNTTLLVTAFLCLTLGLQGQTFVSHNLNPQEVKVIRLGSNVNSTASDLAPIRYGDRIYFSSTRHQSSDRAPVSRIYSFTDGKKAALVPDLNFKRKSSHVGQIAIMPDASRMYFTICKDETQEKCSLWYRDRTFDGDWGAAKPLPQHVNVSGHTTTQPAVGWDEEQKKFVLYFVTDRPGGHGGLDIWCSAISWDGKYETPYPLPLNSAQDDVTPFFDRAAQVLYFSTNGHGGAGGFDIFLAEKKSDMWTKPYSLGRPFNSSYDDLYFSMHESSKMAYFTSDRPGSLCGGAKGGECYDLYQVNQSVPKFRTRSFEPEESPSVSNNFKRTR